MERTAIMRAEVKADCYTGENHDQISNYFNVYCEGDKQDSNDTDDIIIKCAELPPGATIEVQYPCCPDCGIPREDKFEFLEGGRAKIIGHAEHCECGFDWQNWVAEQYA